jgi:hypothetical protein
MRKLAVVPGIALALPLLAPAQALAQAKVRIAIWEFENNSQGSWWFSNQLGPAVRNHVDTAFSEDPRLCPAVLGDRARQAGARAQGAGPRATSGAVDARTAASVGKLLGVRYILIGAVDSFTINNTEPHQQARRPRRQPGVRPTPSSACASSTRRPAERLVSVSAEAGVKKGGGAFRGTSLSRDAEWGLASEAIEKAADELVKKFVTGNYASRFVADGALAKLEGQGHQGRRRPRLDQSRHFGRPQGGRPASGLHHRRGIDRPRYRCQARLHR